MSDWHAEKVKGGVRGTWHVVCRLSSPDSPYIFTIKAVSDSPAVDSLASELLALLENATLKRDQSIGIWDDACHLDVVAKRMVEASQ